MTKAKTNAKAPAAKPATKTTTKPAVMAAASGNEPLAATTADAHQQALIDQKKSGDAESSGGAAKQQAVDEPGPGDETLMPEAGSDNDILAGTVTPLSEDSNWKVLALQSDEHTTVEAVGIVGYQANKGALLRYRVDGKIVGKVEFVQGFNVKLVNKIWQLR